jgi:hypothetical protein
MILHAGSGSLAQNNEFPELTGPYLGQQPPGMTPEIFAPGIISTNGDEGSSGFALNGSVYIFQRFIDHRCHTYIMTLEGNRWSEPELIPFWKQLLHNGDFVIDPDDRTMFYQVKSEVSGLLQSDIWEVKLAKDGWGKRSALLPPINTDFDESFASRASNGNLYFFSNRPGGKGKSDLYWCEYKGGVYGEPFNISELNTEYHEWDPYISPDEKYLIFCSTKPEGYGKDDLYISFKDKNNEWCSPVNMGKAFNSANSENRPYVTNDGRYFFYTSSKTENRDIYWVDAKIIDELK